MSLSVLIPTAGRDTLARCLRSVRPQLQAGDECIVIGDTHDGRLLGVEQIVAMFGPGFRYLAHDAGHHCFGHCVTGDTVLDACGIRSVMRRAYRGPMLTVRTANGGLSITPDHPVLTERGWILAGEVEQGDYLFRTGFEHRFSGGEPNIDYRPTQAAKLFDTLANRGPIQRMPWLSMDLDSQRRDGEVDVVRPSRLLGHDSHNALCRQHAEQLPLTLADLPGGFGFAGKRNPLAVEQRVCLAAPAALFAGDAGQSRPFLRAGHANALSLASRPEFDASIGQPFSDSFAGAVQFCSEHVDRLASPVTFDQVRDVSRTFMDGHVYDLETDSQWYTANGLIIHNCQLNYGIERSYGDYIFGNDDDDIFTEHAFGLIRKAIARQPEPRPLLFRFESYFGPVYWDARQVREGHIGGHCAVFPNIPGRLGRFTCRYNGDYDYIRSTLDLWPGGDAAAVWVDKIIAIARPMADQLWARERSGTVA